MAALDGSQANEFMTQMQIKGFPTRAPLCCAIDEMSSRNAIIDKYLYNLFIRTTFVNILFCSFDVTCYAFRDYIHYIIQYTVLWTVVEIAYCLCAILENILDVDMATLPSLSLQSCTSKTESTNTTFHCALPKR